MGQYFYLEEQVTSGDINKLVEILTVDSQKRIVGEWWILVWISRDLEFCKLFNGEKIRFIKPLEIHKVFD